LCEALSGRAREVMAAGERFRAEHGRAPQPGELRRLKLENRRSKMPRTRADLDRAWRETADAFAFGPGVLVGPAGTGKGVTIDAAARAEQHAGRTTLGLAVSGSTAERLGRDSPSLAGQTLTVDSLIAGARSGRLPLDRHTTVFWDEAGMADTSRLHELTGLIDRAGAKLILIGDGQQLPAIGPGGMFDRLTARMPVVELQEVRRTLDPSEQKAWRALRSGKPELAMVHFHSRGRLHFADTREQAAENAVQAWAKLTQTHDPSQVALIADASNLEIDRLNARAQHLRARRGELGSREVPLGSVHYGLRQGDRVAFIAQHYPPGERRVENGTRGEIVHVQADRVTVALNDTGRQVSLQGEQLETLRLGYAQHVYRQQGATVAHAIVLSGGWQTSKETAYVQASRARHGAHWHLAREELGHEGTDPDRIERLAQKMRTSRAQTPSVGYRASPDPVEPPDGTLPTRPRRTRLPALEQERPLAWPR
jgi:ATP-dependent exoDNAse (exonuclease V) alpha subunit